MDKAAQCGQEAAKHPWRWRNTGMPTKHMRKAAYTWSGSCQTPHAAHRDGETRGHQTTTHIEHDMLVRKLPNIKHNPWRWGNTGIPTQADSQCSLVLTGRAWGLR